MPTMTMRRPQGVTLLEMMIASAIAAVIMLGLTMIEGTRVRVTEDLRLRVLTEPERKNAALAAVHLAKDLETSDRFEVLPDGTNSRLNVRTPDCPPPVTAACLDDPLNYQWVQYRLDATSRELRMYRFARTASPVRPLPCPARQVLARDITALTSTLTNNEATYSLRWENGTRNQTFQGRVITRFKPETGVPLGLQNPSGTDISPPPGGTGCN